MACLREHAGARPGLLGVWRIFCGVLRLRDGSGRRASQDAAVLKPGALVCLRPMTGPCTRYYPGDPGSAPAISELPRRSGHWDNDTTVKNTSRARRISPRRP
jgi:hypothetical protein